MVNEKLKIGARNLPRELVMLTGVVRLCWYCEVALRHLDASGVAASGDRLRLSSVVGAVDFAGSRLSGSAVRGAAWIKALW